MIGNNRPLYDDLVDSLFANRDVRRFLKSRIVRSQLKVMLFGDATQILRDLDEIEAELEEAIEERYAEDKWEWHDLHGET